MSCSGLSLFATSSLLTFLAYTAIREHKSRRNPLSSRALERKSNHPQGYIWLVNLFIADFVQALGSFLSTHGLIVDSVMPGPYCVIQGLVLQWGLLAGALWTFIVTCRAWVVEKSASGKSRWVIVAGIWLFILFIGLFGLMFIQPFESDGWQYYNHAGAGWCWIDARYFWERIFFFYDMITLTILYSAVFFYIRFQSKKYLRNASSSRDLPTNENGAWQCDVESGVISHPPATQSYTMTSAMIRTEETRIPPPKPTSQRRLTHASRVLLCYPVVYFVLVLPLAVSRLMEFANQHWSLTAVYVGGTLFDCQGWVNVILYTATRQGIISWDRLFKKSDENIRKGSITTSIDSSFSDGKDSSNRREREEKILPDGPTFPLVSEKSRSIDTIE